MANKGGRADWLFASLHGYSLSRLPRDAVAALVLTAIALPGQLATARLMGLPPMTGLFAFAAGALAFAALGANRYASVAADSTIAPIMAGALALMVAPGSPHYAALAAVLALLVGVALLAAGLLRAGWIADLLSVPVTVGFLAGIAVHIIVGQLPEMLGVPPPAKGHVLVQLLAIGEALPQAKFFPILIGFGVLACTLIAEWLSPRIPGPLIGVVSSALAAWWLALDQHGVTMLGALPIAPPSLTLAIPSWNEFVRLIPLSFTVALVCMMQTAAVVRSFPSDPKQPEDVSRDFAGVGASSILAGMTGSFAVDASPPSTAAVAESGGTSQVCSLLAAAIIAAIVLLAGGAFAFVPQAALSGVLVYIALRICRVTTMLQIYRYGGNEILLVAASAALVVIMPIQTGVAMSIGLSLLNSLYVVAWPDSAVLERVPGTTVWWDLPAEVAGEHEPGVLVFSPGAPINFTNAFYVRGKLMHAIAAMRQPCRLVVIEANGIINFDFTGSQILQEVISELRERGIDVVVARLESETAHRAAERSGLMAKLGEDHVFRSVEDAIQAHKRRPG
jgi:sulfate permease, SulP family